MFTAGRTRRLLRSCTRISAPRLRALHAAPVKIAGPLNLKSPKINQVEPPAEKPEARSEALKEMPFLDRPYPRVRPRVARGESSEAMRVKGFVEKYRVLQANDHLRRPVNLSGRIRSMRVMSSKLIFYDIQEDGHRVQIMHSWSDVGGTEWEFRNWKKLFRVGDIVNATGHPARTQGGELTLRTNKPLRMQAPCLHQIPDHLVDGDKILHRRHLELLTNPTTSAILRIRSLIIRTFREFFHKHDFVEVETPILSYSSGGAVAKPFLTEAVASYRGKPLALRIAPELWLKRLVIGGMDRVFEIGPQFRDEHIDATHNPEFTTCEFYIAYHNLDMLMAMTQDIFRAVDAAVTASIAANPTWGKILPKSDIDWSQPFQTFEFIPKLEELTGATIPALDTTPTDTIVAELTKIFESHSIPLPPNPTPAKLLDKLSSHFLEPLCIQPTFIVHHPEIMSPLAKTFPRFNGLFDHRCALRFELFVNGKELVNAYEEENDPGEQRRKFLIQSNGGEIDDGYVEALEFGLPPTGGWGCGIDRTVMLFTGAKKIREVLAFGGIRGAINQGGEATYMKAEAAMYLKSRMEEGGESVERTENKEGKVQSGKEEAKTKEQKEKEKDPRYLAMKEAKRVKMAKKREEKKKKKEAGLRWLEEKEARRRAKEEINGEVELDAADIEAVGEPNGEAKEETNEETKEETNEETNEEANGETKGDMKVDAPQN